MSVVSFQCLITAAYCMAFYSFCRGAVKTYMNSNIGCVDTCYLVKPIIC